MAVAAVVRHFHLLAGATRPRRIELTGALANPAETISALYIGSGANQDFLARLLMDEPREKRADELAGYGQVAAALASAPAGIDAIVTDLPPLRATLTPGNAQFRFPAWVRQELSLPAKAGAAGWLLSRAVEREAARQARRHGYTVDFVHDESSLLRFFHELYRPYVSARFGAGAIVASQDQFQQRARHAVLARLICNGHWIAGMLLEKSRRAVRFGWFGATGGAPQPGASEVLDVACIRHAHEAGVRRILLGHSRPSLADGVLHYKARLGAQLRAVRYPQAVLSIAVRRRHAALFNRLNERQLIDIRGRSIRILTAS